MSDEKRCATCLHWRSFDAIDAPDKDESEPITERSSPWTIARRRRLGLCAMASQGTAKLDTLALAVDGSDYRYDLRTDATFGCVQWEKQT